MTISAGAKTFALYLAGCRGLAAADEPPPGTGLLRGGQDSRVLSLRGYKGKGGFGGGRGRTKKLDCAGGCTILEKVHVLCEDGGGDAVPCNVLSPEPGAGW